MVVPLATSMVTVLQVVRVGRRCWRFPVWVVWCVGVWQVWCGADGGVLGDGVVSAARGEGVVGDVVGGRWRVVVVVVAGLLGGCGVGGGPDDGPWVCGGGWACMVVVMVCHCGWCWVWYRWACGLR